MIFIRKTFDFIGRHAALILPVFLLSLVPQALAFLATGSFPSEAISKLMPLLGGYYASPDAGQTADVIIAGISKIVTDTVPNFGTMMTVFFVSSFLLSIFLIPGVYATIARGLSGEQMTVRTASPLFYKYTPKYLTYIAGLFFYWLFWGFAAVLLLLLVVVFSIMLQSAQAVIIYFALALLFGAFIYLGFIIVLWYPAMAVEGVNLETGLRKSVKVVRRFTPLILLTYIGVYAVNFAILYFFNGMTPSLTGQMIAGVVMSVLVTFFLMVFRVIIYKTYVDIEKMAYQKMLEKEAADKAAENDKPGEMPKE